MERDWHSEVPAELAALAARLKELQQEAARVGLFPSDRPLLECPVCGLYEDVRFDGRLMTCFASDRAGADTGLRFPRVPAGFRCPGCQHVLVSPEEEEA
jgi:hypothetical protein